MPYNRRDRTDGNSLVVHITNRTVVALPFVRKKYMELILLGILGKAQAKYPVQINHYLWMGNHYHLILSGNSKHLSPFMNIVDGEIGKALKRLYPGLFQTKVWSSRFKEQKLACVDSVLEKIAYTYLNPVNAGLIRTIREYPGLHSWNNYRNGSHIIDTFYVPPSKLRPISRKIRDWELVRRLKKKAAEQNVLVLAPDAWRNRFELSKGWSGEEIFKKIIVLIVQGTPDHDTPCLGAKVLRTIGHMPSYRPKKVKGERTPYIICKDPQLRKILIAKYKSFCRLCEEAWELWRLGLISQFPRGAYRPSMPLVKLRV